jgi:hypothetical protein
MSGTYSIVERLDNQLKFSAMVSFNGKAAELVEIDLDVLPRALDSLNSEKSDLLLDKVKLEEKIQAFVVACSNEVDPALLTLGEAKLTDLQQELTDLRQGITVKEAEIVALQGQIDNPSAYVISQIETIADADAERLAVLAKSSSMLSALTFPESKNSL